MVNFFLWRFFFLKKIKNEWGGGEIKGSQSLFPANDIARKKKHDESN